MKNKKLLLLIMLTCITSILTSCGEPAITLTTPYSDSSKEINIEYGTPVSTDTSEYINFDELSSDDKSFVLSNVKIKYNGEKVEGQDYDKPGEYTLTIKYCGMQYRKFAVNIKDTTVPVFTKSEDINTFAGSDENPEDFKGMFAVEDNSDTVIDVDTSAVDIDTPGDYTVTATATDIGNNKATESAVVHVQAPVYGAQGTYIFISVFNQTLTYFENSIPVFTSPVVTGDISKNHSTPYGVYSINSKRRNTKLTGQDYEIVVSYWMGFIGNSYGIHSAPWRSDFGGDIYKTDGSHGCVNMPINQISILFNLVSIGTPVIVG